MAWAYSSSQMRTAGRQPSARRVRNWTAATSLRAFGERERCHSGLARNSAAKASGCSQKGRYASSARSAASWQAISTAPLRVTGSVPPGMSSCARRRRARVASFGGRPGDLLRLGGRRADAGRAARGFRRRRRTDRSGPGGVHPRAAGDGQGACRLGRQLPAVVAFRSAYRTAPPAVGSTGPATGRRVSVPARVRGSRHDGRRDLPGVLRGPVPARTGAAPGPDPG